MEPLYADFTASPSSGPAPLTVQFTDTTEGLDTDTDWDFGDGTSSTEKDPGHTYTGAGTFTVEMVASNSGASDTKTGTITVTAGSNNPPSIDITSPSNNQAVTSSDITVAGSAYDTDGSVIQMETGREQQIRAIIFRLRFLAIRLFILAGKLSLAGARH